jgi:hypothetical protein
LLPAASSPLRRGEVVDFAAQVVGGVVDDHHVRLETVDLVREVQDGRPDRVAGHTAVDVVELHVGKARAQLFDDEVRPDERVAAHLGAEGSRSAEKGDADAIGRLRRFDRRTAKAARVDGDVADPRTGDEHAQRNRLVDLVEALVARRRAVLRPLPHSDQPFGGGQHDHDPEQQHGHEHAPLGARR